MNYFVDSDLGSAITGVEQAEFNRLTLFHRAGMPATIVYLTYKPRMRPNTRMLNTTTGVIIGKRFVIISWSRSEVHTT